MEIKELREKLNFTQKEFGEKIGLSISGVQALEAKNRDAKKSLVKLIRLLFWRELDIPQQEICKELDLDCGSSAIEPVYDPGLKYGELSDREKELLARVRELEQRERVLITAIDNLNNQLKSK